MIPFWTVIRVLYVLKITLFNSLVSVKGVLDPECDISCNCCIDKQCQVGYNNWPNVCTKGCIDGHYGARCYELCTYKCPSCDHGIDMCTKCYEGFYLGTNKDCKSECPSNCKSCFFNTFCTSCKEGYFNRGGFTRCQHNCSVGCKDNTCNVETGNCACLTNFIGNKCDKCVDGKYGPLCSQVCSQFCQNTKCDQRTGHCSDGCISANLIGETCNECKVVMYGDLCDKNCPTNCLDMKCNRQNGSCSHGCEENSQGVMCDACKPGKYGTNCDLNCSDKCVNTLCGKYNGNCLNCYGNFDGSKCDICKPGYYGLSCNDFCSQQCKDITCHMSSGACDSGCINTYSGDMCCVVGGNCMKCANNSKCKACESGYYGRVCERKCPDNCVDACDISSGACAKCEDGYFGLICNETCSSLCVESVCNQISGLCERGCTSCLDDPVCARFYVKPISIADSNSSRVTTVVLATLLALAVTACIILIVIMIYRKMRLTRRRETEELTFPVGNQTQSDGGITATSDVDNIAYESILHVQDSDEHTYNILNRSTQENMVNVASTAYVNLQVR